MFFSIVHNAEIDFKIFGLQNYGPHFTHTFALTVRKFWSAFYLLTVHSSTFYTCPGLGTSIRLGLESRVGML